jgi:hypothetical protein
VVNKKIGIARGGLFPAPPRHFLSVAARTR